MIMAISTRFLLRGSIWTIGAFSFGQAIRMVTAVILARLLAPELFGIMLIVSSLRAGIELLSDVGILQSMVYHKDAEDPDFYNTAWTLGVIRSILLWLIAVIVAVPAARFYQSPILVWVAPLSTFSIVLVGFTSVSRLLLRKRLQIAKLNAVDTIISVTSSAVSVLIAYLSPTIWALAFGGVFSAGQTLIVSYFLLPDVKQRFHLSNRFAWEILHYGKWIVASSMVFFLSTNFDRLYLAKVVPLKVFGVYGIATSFAGLLNMLVMQLGQDVLFPFITAHGHVPRTELREKIGSARAKFLLLAAFGFSFFVATADLVIKVLYDERYQAARWMLPVLFIGSWFSMLACLNESSLLGVGKPSYNAIANTCKFAFLLIGLPLGVMIYGLFGGITIVALADLCRYVPGFVGLVKERFSFGTQDFFYTLMLLGLIGLWQWLRFVLGFGTSLEMMPF
jgi:O-antigen/teichoic acid export membrane protein